MDAPVCDPKAQKAVNHRSIRPAPAGLHLRIVVPWSGQMWSTLPRLNPHFQVADESVVMATTLIGGLPARILREPIANLADQQAEIVGAVEMLVTGV